MTGQSTSRTVCQPCPLQPWQVWPVVAPTSTTWMPEPPQREHLRTGTNAIAAANAHTINRCLHHRVGWFGVALGMLDRATA